MLKVKALHWNEWDPENWDEDIWADFSETGSLTPFILLRLFCQ